MKVLITGSTGLVGSALRKSLKEKGHLGTALVRKSPKGDEIQWDIEDGPKMASRMEEYDAAVHLAGENIASGRWTDAKKKKILKSRTKGTKIFSNALAGLSKPPKVLVSASAIGIYGDRGDEALDEQSAAGSGFLADVCQQWEDSTKLAEEKGIRVVKLRIGVVMSRRGGALAKMLPPFKMGGGGVIGSGNQYMSWVDLDDLVSIILFAIENESARGPLNAVAPNPVTNREFTKTLGSVLKRPTIFPMPGFVAKALFGEMADAMLLSGCRVIPKKLQELGFTFDYGTLRESLNHQLKK